MEGRRQLRLLLWKDYLIRKRKVITLAGLIWASAVMFSLHIVRTNVDNEVHPTCGFPARALPSAGMLPFLQSFLCTVTNECSPLDQFDEIPTYENSKLTQLMRRLAPVLNESTLEVASSVPDALKLVSTLADVADQPAFVEITKNGLHVKDLFAKPSRVKRFVEDRLGLASEVTEGLMDAQLGFQGLLTGSLDRCSSESLSKTLIVKNPEHLNKLVEKVCSMSMGELQKVLVDLLIEIDFTKYMTMLGDMYNKLSGDDRLITLGKMLTAVLRMVNIQSFLPTELISIFDGKQVDFSYIQLSLIPKLMNLFEPTFGETQVYGILRDFADAIVMGLQYLDKLFTKIRASKDLDKVVAKSNGVLDSKSGLQALSNVLHHTTDVIEDVLPKNSSFDAFTALSHITNFVTKFVSSQTKHEVLFYSTLLAKLIESASRVVDINMHIEQLSYNVTLRHPGAVDILRDVQPEVLGKAFEGLADAERVQILTSKINSPEKVFCDTNQLKKFLEISQQEQLESLKKQLCTDAWKNYIADMIRSFGVFEVKDNINRMASLLIQETLGKDTSDQLYTIEQDFQILRNFTQTVTQLNAQGKSQVDWRKLLKLDQNPELMKILEKKGPLGKQMLIVLHGALAKEIVTQNALLDFKISPYLDDVITLTSGIIQQLEMTPVEVANGVKNNYGGIVMTVMRTAINEEKTYKSLSTPGQDILCNDVETARAYLELPADDNEATAIVKALCNATIAIENGLSVDSAVTKAIKTITSSSKSLMSTNWIKLINNLKGLYVRLDRDYPFVFNFSHYSMDVAAKGEVDRLVNTAREYWFGLQSLERTLHLSVKLGFRFLDLLDYGLFNVTGDSWLKIKHAISVSVGPISVFDEVIQLVGALVTNSSYHGDLPPTTVAALSDVIPNIPQLTVDATHIIVKDETDIQPIIGLLNASPPWPCSSTSLSELLPLSPRSTAAIQGLETMLCMEDGFQEEWVLYFRMKNVTISGTAASLWNTTVYPPHLFLKFSSSFDSLVNDIGVARDILNYVFKDSEEGEMGLKEAWKYAVKALNTPEKHVILSKAFTKIDSILNSVDTSSIAGNVSANHLWENFVNCSRQHIDSDCRLLGRKAWKYLLGAISVIIENGATDLLAYFTEINEPDSNFLQLVGFTKNTALYLLYDKMPEFVGVLLNSYWDYNFMSQVRRASQSQFWDCDAVVGALVPPPDCPVSRSHIDRVKPFICPSLLHWLSLPTGENTLLDVFAKPQYFFFTIKVQNITSSFANAYHKAVELTDFVTQISKKNQTMLTEKDMNINSIQEKLKKIVDKVLSYKLDENDPSYRLFNNINFKQFTASIYLTRIVGIVSKLQENINKVDVSNIIEGTDEEVKTMEADLGIIKYLFKRKAVDAINIHFDAITDVVDKNNENYTLIDALNKMCEDIQTNDNSRTILNTDKKTAKQFCLKKYGAIYGAVESSIVDDYPEAENSLLNLVRTLKNNGDDVKDVFGTLRNRTQLVAALKTSIKYSYELNIPVYLKYLHSNIQGYDIILSFLAGEDWWARLRDVYNGPYATKFFTYLEKSFDVAENLLTNFDDIHIVRLLGEINVNETESVCQPHVVLADYLPDATGLLSDIKRQVCGADKTELYRELPPLLYASQGYESSLKVSKEVDYTTLNTDISKLESKLELIKDGPRVPQSPPWVTEERLQHLRQVALGLLSKQSLTKMAFTVLSNGVDAGTLYLNSSQCTICSHLTSWLKQLNLQLFKKQEYDNLLCHLQTLSLADVHNALKTDFHWDMMIKELISTRNYTKYEMNKSLGEFLGHVKLYLLEDIAANTTKLADCLAKNITRNELGNATLLASVLSHTGKLLRAELPHVHEVEGIKDVPFLKELYREIAHKLDIEKPLAEYLNDHNHLHDKLMKIVDLETTKEIEDARINLRKVRNLSDSLNGIALPKGSCNVICDKYNCSKIVATLMRQINATKVDNMLPKYQQDEFWRFKFVSTIIHHAEELVAHGSRLLGVASKLDLAGLQAGRVDALLDTGLLLVQDDIVDSILYSLLGLVTELEPLLESTPLDADLRALSSGLAVLRQFKNYLLEEVDLKMEVSALFESPERIESELLALGINNTNFWSVAAPRLYEGHIQLKPLLKEHTRISTYACSIDAMSRVLLPANLDVVNADDVSAAVVDQFCGLPDHTAREILAVLFRNLNFTPILDFVKTKILTKLYIASNLTEAEGASVLAKYPQMAALMPLVQDNVGYVSDLFANEPMFQSLQDFNSVGNLFSSEKFMSSAGNILCGKPFKIASNKFYNQIAATQDLSAEPDQAQLDVLPTDFCRSLYLDVVSQDGGKILWSFLKPLVMGKILYTPHNPTVQRIIEKANSTFAPIVKMVELVHSFAKSFPSVDRLQSHRGGIAALRNVMTNPMFSPLWAMIIDGGGDDVSTQDFNVDELFDEFGDVDSMGKLLSKASDLLHCLNLDRFHPSPSEYELTHDAAVLSTVSEFLAGLVFLNSEEQNESLSSVEYKIRMDIENVPTTIRLMDYLWIPGPESNFIENMRYFRGFIEIQDIIDNAIIQLSAASARPSDSTEKELQWAVYTQQTPYPCYTKDYFQTSLYESQSMIVAFFFALLFSVASAVRFVVSDKETGNTMLMSVMGVDLRWHTLSWFLSSFVEMTLTMASITVILYAGNILPTTNPGLVFTLLLIFGLSMLSFCYMISKLFRSASLAAVCGAILYLLTFMPFVIILSLEALLYVSLKFLICLSMSSSLCYAFLCLARFEAHGAGAGWAQLWAAPADERDMSVGLAALMLLVDAAVYFVIGWLIDRCFGIKTLKSNITYCTTSNEKAGVSIVNVSKTYHERSRRSKLALDNVSIELHKGQITTLLGHNGAGKTTLINILTGMLRPSKGHVIVRSERALCPRLGVCPQRDVLFEALSAREHVQLYAQLKGTRAPELRHEVDRMLEVLSLGGVCSEPVWRLSGGTRRRLCVALAFVGAPHLVSLDEPTAGVDPAARRDIWSMIVKLKQDKTILMTTHHLDEAELLSDQIVILHKGQIHTTGSPIEIKRTLGNGYKLTVMYPDKADTDEILEEMTQEEKTKQLLTVVRDVVKNANVTDVNDLEVEIGLPFFDVNGLNNNFLQLCSVLEASQSALGFKSFTVDCSSLEQVFFNICQQADTPLSPIEYTSSESVPTKSASSSSVRTDRAPQQLVAPDGPVKGSSWEQFSALLYARYLHHVRNRWLLFMLIVLPSLFVSIAMAFSMLRPPADNEVALRLDGALYVNTTDFIVPHPSRYSEQLDPSFAESVIGYLMADKHTRNWTEADSPTCECGVKHQVCNVTSNMTAFPGMMVLPDVNRLNKWLVDTQEIYIEKRYGGYSSSLKNNVTNLVAWYNNKGHHSAPAHLNALNSALLRAASGAASGAAITTYTHPLKISREQLTKATVYQYVADAGISGLVLVAYALVSAGAAIYLVSARRAQEKRLQLLCGVSPLVYWGAALAWDMLIIAINTGITAAVMAAFGFPVFVSRNNLPAICLLLIVYGYACGNLIHVAEKMFSEASVANMVLFCGNAFLGLSFIAILLIFDIISESELTDYVRYVLHKLFMLAPQFALGDGLLEIAKNTIRAQVLGRFGMDTYKDPLGSDLITLHFTYLVLVGTALLLLNLAIEYNCFDGLLLRFRSDKLPPLPPGELEAVEVSEERKRVRSSRLMGQHTLHGVTTIGNINRGFVPTEGSKNSIQRLVAPLSDVAQCEALSKAYRGSVALRDLTLGVPPGQCTALLGQNGAGKSTTFSLLTGEIKPTCGHVYLNNKRASSTQLCTGLISYCPQSDAIDPLLTVEEILRFYCRLRGIADQEKVIPLTLEQFELAAYARVRSGALSGGNKRKLCAALAFMARSPLVLLDEPTSGMDPVSRGCVARGVRGAVAARRGVLLATHALDDARRLAARVALLRAGRLAALDQLDRCLDRFGGGYVVQCRAGRGGARAAWRRLRARAPHAALRVLHQHSLHALVPTHATVNNKEVTTRLSDIFRLMAEMQATCDIEDYTVNQSSLEQMFLSFTDNAGVSTDVDVEPLPSLPTPPPPADIGRDDDTDTVTAL